MLDIAAVKERTNLLDLISTTTDLRKVGAKEFSGSCPKCGGRDRFHYNEDRGWFCRVCTQAPDDGGHWHDAIDFIQWRDGCDFMTAYNRLGGDTRMSPAESAQLLAERTVRQQEQRKAEQAAQADRRRELDTSNAWANFHANLDRYDKRELWTRRGLSPFWQDYYKVGYCPSRSFAHADDFFTSETLTIPTFYVTQVKYECIALVHRLLIAEPPGGKYRPHLAGTGKPLFYTDPLRSEFMPGGDVLIVEGGNQGRRHLCLSPRVR